MHDSKEIDARSDRQTDNDITRKQENHNPHLENFEMFMPVVPKPVRGLYSNWGHQAMLTYRMGKALWLSPLISKKYHVIICYK